MWPLRKSMLLGKMSTCSKEFQHTFIVSKANVKKIIYFSTKPRHLTPQIERLGKTNTVLRVSKHLWGFSRQMLGKTLSLLE